MIQRNCEYCKKEFEVDVPSNKKRFCNKKCANADPNVKQKIRDALQERWDKDGHPMNNPIHKETHKNTLIEHYGVEYALQNKNLVTKSHETKLRKYGTLKSTSAENAKDIKYQKMLEWTHITPLFTREEYNGVSLTRKYAFKCNTCGYEFSRLIASNYTPHCRTCGLKNFPTTSQAELEILDYIKQIYGGKISGSNREVLDGKELDIYIPAYNLAIEYNGLFWHGEKMRGDKDYHKWKSEQCKQNNIQLLHIFEHQWRDKQEIVKSMISSKLKMNSKIYARKCNIQIVNNTDAKTFLNTTHIQGYTVSAINLGLYYENELVAIMTFLKSRFDKSYDYELIRYSSKLFTNVIGGFSKLLSCFIKTYNPHSIISYCDLSRSNGNVYEKNNFMFLENTAPNYYYFDKSYNVFSRYIFQKHKLSKILEKFDIVKTEYENMLENGYDRIWDCGSAKYILVIKNA